jgi:hypothetical protein
MYQQETDADARISTSVDAILLGHASLRHLLPLADTRLLRAHARGKREEREK